MAKAFLLPLLLCLEVVLCEVSKKAGHDKVHVAVVVKTALGSHFEVGEFTTHFRTYSSGDWDVHWGYGVLTHSRGGQMNNPQSRIPMTDGSLAGAHL